ncbi:DUF3047 domain-containing protein [Halopseudomonas pachastrellae]|nr:DUF3047 domain-containing protein [Halopseudomonas pachastrellae]
MYHQGFTAVIRPALCRHLRAAQSYSPADISQWSERRFSEPTSYRLEQRGDSALLRADCSNGQASARYLEQQIDLRKTPVLRWSWTISQPFSGLNERQREGDDYPVRLYVVKDGGLLPWRTLAVNYVVICSAGRHALAQRLHRQRANAGREQAARRPA